MCVHYGRGSAPSKMMNYLIQMNSNCVQFFKWVCSFGLSYASIFHTHRCHTIFQHRNSDEFFLIETKRSCSSACFTKRKAVFCWEIAEDWVTLFLDTTNSHIVCLIVAGNSISNGKLMVLKIHQNCAFQKRHKKEPTRIN